MELSQTIQCPFCWQSFEVQIDPQDGQFTLDCEVCCRPLEVLVLSVDDEPVRLEVRPN